MKHWLSAFVLLLLPLSVSAHVGFSDDDRQQLADMFVSGAHNVTLLIATYPHRAREAAARVRALGGTVQYLASDVDYLRADVPLDHVEDFASIPAVQMADVNSNDTGGTDGETIAGTSFTAISDLPTPGPHTPRANAFTGTMDVGAPQFVAAYPTFDGRGVTIATFEPADPLSPFLQWARTLNGQRVPKVVDYLVPGKPYTMHGSVRIDNFGWVNMATVVRTHARRFQYHGHTFIAPSDGIYRVGTFTLSPSLENIVHPHGTAFEKANTFTVLWRESRGTVWVNANQNGTFADDRPMQDFAQHRDIGILTLAERVPDSLQVSPSFRRGFHPSSAHDFWIECDAHDKYVYLGFSWGGAGHATGVAGSAAGEGYFGGAFDGMAPGARILPSAYADGATALENMIQAARIPGVNQFTLSGSSFAESVYSVPTIILNRLMERYHLVMTSAIGNDGPKVGGINTPSNPSNVFGIGGSLTRERLLLNFGARVAVPEFVVNYSARGPANDGGFKPDFLAPTEALTAQTLTEFPGRIQQTKFLPVGYQIFGGTSQAAPMAAGAIALLISAAQQRHVPYDYERLRRAIFSTARWLPDFQAYDQGVGVIDVSKAWEALQREPAELTRIEASSSVRTGISAQLPIPNRGVGLYERDGWYPGMSGVRTMTYIRRTGPSGRHLYHVLWQGNDGTFSTTSTIGLTLNRPTDLPIRVMPRNAGAHSAILKLLDPQTGQVVDWRMCMIVATDRLTAANHFTLQYHGSVRNPLYKAYFVTVPPGTRNLTVNLEIAQRDLWKYPWFSSNFALLRVITPTQTGSTSPREVVQGMYARDGRMLRQSYPDPLPGVWEIDINNGFGFIGGDVNLKAHDPQSPTSYVLRISTYRIDADQTESIGANALRYTLSNAMAPLSLRGTASPLGSQSKQRITLTNSKPHAIIDIDVPDHTEDVRASLQDLSDPNADVWLYLYYCQKDTKTKMDSCKIWASTTSRHGSGIADAMNPSDGTNLDIGYIPYGASPPKGHWRVFLDARRLPHGGVSFDYSDVIVNKKYGWLTMPSSSDAVLQSGETWAILATVKRGDAVPAGRQLVAVPSVTSAQTYMTLTPLKHGLISIGIRDLDGRKLVLQRVYQNVWSTITNL